MIFEPTGGLSVEAGRVLKCLDNAVTVNSDSPEKIVATQFWQRICVVLLRGSCKSFHTRLIRKGVEGNVGVTIESYCDRYHYVHTHNAHC